MRPVKLDYQGAAPTGSATHTMFDTLVACPGKYQLQMGGAVRFVYDIRHDESGTLTLQKTKDRGAASPTWTTVEVVSVTTAATAVTTKGSFLIEAFDDFRVTWTNGGTAQAVWVADIALSMQRDSG